MDIGVLLFWGFDIARRIEQKIEEIPAQRPKRPTKEG
jgi:hypothetical protein